MNKFWEKNMYQFRFQTQSSNLIARQLPSKGSNYQIWVQDLWQFLFQTLIRLNEWLWDQEKCQIRFSSHKSLKSTNSSSSSREKHALAPISDPKKSKALNLSVKQEPIQISDPHQAKWINFERKTCTNSDFRLNDQTWEQDYCIFQF